MKKAIVLICIVSGLLVFSTAAALAFQGSGANQSAREAPSDFKLSPSSMRSLVVLGGALLTGLFNLVSRAFRKDRGGASASAAGSEPSPRVSAPPPAGYTSQYAPPREASLPPNPPPPNPPPPRGAATSFVVARNGFQFGPYTRAEALQYLASGQILRTDLGRKEGDQQWLPILQLLDSESAQSALPEPAAKVLVGDKYGYYEAKWASLGARKSRLSWNWAAFFFGPTWLAYRKMHSYAWAYIAVVIVDSIAEVVLRHELIPGTVFMVMNLMFAIQGNYWYQTHVFKRIGEILRNPPHLIQGELRRRGGTSMGAAVFVFFFLGIVSCLPLLFDQH